MTVMRVAAAHLREGDVVQRFVGRRLGRPYAPWDQSWQRGYPATPDHVGAVVSRADFDRYRDRTTGDRDHCVYFRAPADGRRYPEPVYLRAGALVEVDRP